MFKADTKKIFDSVQVSESHCEDCHYLTSTVEEYEIWGCKDRDIELSCTGTHMDCQIVESIAQDVEGFIADNTDTFNLIEVCANRSFRTNRKGYRYV